VVITDSSIPLGGRFESQSPPSDDQYLTQKMNQLSPMGNYYYTLHPHGADNGISITTLSEKIERVVDLDDFLMVPTNALQA
jgi:hypothetical protein